MIYQMYLIRNAAPLGQSFLDLSEDQQKALMEADRQSRDEAGARDVVSAYSLWANEDYYGWGVLAFPNETARIQHTRRMEKVGWFKHVSAMTLLGTPMPQMPETTQLPFANPIYSLWVIQNNPATAVNAARHTDQENIDRFNAMLKALKDCGGVGVMVANSYWNNEGYPFFGVEAFPDFESLRGYYAELDKLHWADYVSGFTVLGISDDRQ